mgnify:CR=1 FL=1
MFQSKVSIRVRAERGPLDSQSQAAPVTRKVSIRVRAERGPLVFNINRIIGMTCMSQSAFARNVAH